MFGVLAFGQVPMEGMGTNQESGVLPLLFLAVT